MPYSWIHFLVNGIIGLCGLAKESYAWFRDLKNSHKP